ncbi:hypothetical protein EB796_000417 [Bugula neritina]|uniref:mitogen-activated protein kinase kinase kinase n=1 Tax=Bugula neritina TaxID=10212 RepID=A0A7J7KT30_BUGNE|nr:hypothetical protein EB796_000417 [Bugula neritina]
MHPTLTAPTTMTTSKNEQKSHTTSPQRPSHITVTRQPMKQIEVVLPLHGSSCTTTTQDLYPIAHSPDSNIFSSSSLALSESTNSGHVTDIPRTTPHHRQSKNTMVPPKQQTYNKDELKQPPNSQPYWINGLITCLKPVWSIIGRATLEEKLKDNSFDVKFEEITNLRWLGSGAQGAVFYGKLRGEEVAVKKVKSLKEINIKHLRKLNHPNVISFRGVCSQPMCYSIIMEYCAYGQLYEMLRDEREIPPHLLYSWASQIACGMNYLHTNKIIHRDLKSPNILIGHNDILKISDFGTSKEFQEHERSMIMSFAGTYAWMAPEVIKNEPCSEKVDVWSYGVVLWELLTGEIPYKDVDSTAIIWGVGSASLLLPIPEDMPEGFKLLLKQCWSTKPRNRPTFRHILMHLEIASSSLLGTDAEEFYETQMVWKTQIKRRFESLRLQGTASYLRAHSQHPLEEVSQQRAEEMRNVQEIVCQYKKKLIQTNNLYMELFGIMLQLEQREKELAK